MKLKIKKNIENKDHLCFRDANFDWFNLVVLFFLSFVFIVAFSVVQYLNILNIKKQDVPSVKTFEFVKKTELQGVLSKYDKRKQDFEVIKTMSIPMKDPSI